MQKHLTEIQQAGVRLVAISVDAPEVSSNLAKTAGYTYTILSDPQVEVIRRYGLVHSAGDPDGHDIARPAEFLLDSSGVIRWVNLTENYRVRARPEQIIEQAKALR